jgi:hypothetical protein
VKPKDLREGDICEYEDGSVAYFIDEVLEKTDDRVMARIHWARDGGRDVRTWTQPDEDIPSFVRRPKMTPERALARRAALAEEQAKRS